MSRRGPLPYCERAQALAGRANDKEQALIAALAKRYSADPKADRASLDSAWADALGDVAKRFPDDPELAVLHAEAMMDTQPWDYWTDGGKQPKGRAAEIVSALERAMAKNPDHPGAIHLYIHAVEASDRPERAEPGADRLAALIPGAGHVVHMPSHIYYRVGRYADALAANKAAVAVDEAYIATVNPSGALPTRLLPAQPALPDGGGASGGRGQDGARGRLEAPGRGHGRDRTRRSDGAA